MTRERTAPRHRRRLKLLLADRLPAVTADVSGAGFCAELPQVFLPGSLVHGTLLDGAERYPFRGEVTWAKPGDPQASVKSRIGVRFTELPPGFEAQKKKA